MHAGVHLLRDRLHGRTQSIWPRSESEAGNGKSGNRPWMLSAKPRKPSSFSSKSHPSPSNGSLRRMGMIGSMGREIGRRRQPSQVGTMSRELCGCRGIAHGLGRHFRSPLRPMPPGPRPRLLAQPGSLSFSALARHATLRPAVEPVPSVVDCDLSRRRNTMNWTTPTLVEICIGLEINGYLPAEF